MACSGGESVSHTDLAEGDSLSQVAVPEQPGSDWAAKQEGVNVIAWRTFLIRRRREELALAEESLATREAKIARRFDKLELSLRPSVGKLSI